MKTPPWPLDGKVHLYGLALPQDPAELARLGLNLVPGEIERTDVLKNERAKQRYMAGRGLLREILGGYLGMEPKHVQLASGAHGKPFLVAAGEKLRFNLAHSGDCFLLAVTAKRELGVDIEMIVPGKPLQEMAKVVFSRREQAQLARLGSPDLEAAFYRCWVRKEACLKACGRGFSLPSNSFEVSLLDDATATMVACCDQQHWQVLDLDVAPRYCASLAIASDGSFQPLPIIEWIDHRRSMVFTAAD